jgi:hypothetical protein
MFKINYLLHERVPGRSCCTTSHAFDSCTCAPGHKSLLKELCHEIEFILCDVNGKE